MRGERAEAGGEGAPASRDPVWVIGARGQGKVVVATLLAAGRRVAGILDADESLWGLHLLGCPISGGDGGDVPPAGAAVIVGIGSGRIRERVVASLQGRARWDRAMHPRASVDPSAEIGEGTVVFAGAVVQADARLGRHAIVNTSASVDHDNRLGDFSFVGPGARLAGDVVLEEGAFVGAGATVLPGMRVGAWATVGAGAVVTRDVDAGETVVGVPARVVLRLPR